MNFNEQEKEIERLRQSVNELKVLIKGYKRLLRKYMDIKNAKKNT